MEHIQVHVTNPWLIMAINMTIVFAVLIVLWAIMKILYFIDPTRHRKASIETKDNKGVEAPTSIVETTNNDEVVAAITAAITAMGYSASQIATVRPRKNKNWSYEGRLTGRM